MKEILYKDKPLPDTNSPELDAAKTIQEIVNLYTKTGQIYWDTKIPETSN